MWTREVVLTTLYRAINIIITVQTPVVRRFHHVFCSPNLNLDPVALNRPNSAAGRPSYASNHRDPPSWASRNTEPPSWASQISGSSQISASYGRSNPPSPPPPEYKQPIYAQQTNGPLPAPQWIPADTSTLPSFSTIPSANSVLTSSTGKSAAIALIHREKLQTFHQFLDEALVDSSTDVPHLTDPKGWVEAEGEYITKIVQELASLAENDIILEHAKGVEGMVYPVNICDSVSIATMSSFGS